MGLIMLFLASACMMACREMPVLCRCCPDAAAARARASPMDADQAPRAERIDFEPHPLNVDFPL